MKKKNTKGYAKARHMRKWADKKAAIKNGGGGGGGAGPRLVSGRKNRGYRERRLCQPSLNRM